MVRALLLALALLALGAQRGALSVPNVQPPAASGAWPDVTRVSCDTTKGPVVIEVHPAWAPLGAARFLELVESDYFSDVALFRCIKVTPGGSAGLPELLALRPTARCVT
jgi:hypothetical protein